MAFALPSTRLQLESMASKKGEQVPWLRWCLFQRLIKPSWLRMCVISFQVRLNLRHPIGTEAPPISQCLGVPRCWSCHRLTKFAVHLGPLYLCSKKQSSSQLTAVKDSTYTFLSSNVLESLFKYEGLSHSHILNFSSLWQNLPGQSKILLRYTS